MYNCCVCLSLDSLVGALHYYAFHGCKANVSRYVNTSGLLTWRVYPLREYTLWV
jgi:hypothetical protein